jgi:hypothetical protein
VLFAGVFLWLMWMHDPLSSAAAEPSEVRKRRAAIAFLAVLVVALNLALGSAWRVLFFHVNIAAGFMLLRKDAYAAIAGLAGVTFVLGITSGLAFFALPTTAIGLWATAFVRQVAAVAETSEQLRRAEEVSKLKRQPGRDILVFGSGDLVNTLMQHGLVDEYRLMIFPVVLGSGKRLFREGSDRRALELVDSKRFETGVLYLTYRPKGE